MFYLSSVYAADPTSAPASFTVTITNCHRDHCDRIIFSAFGHHYDYVCSLDRNCDVPQGETFASSDTLMHETASTVLYCSSDNRSTCSFDTRNFMSSCASIGIHVMSTLAYVTGSHKPLCGILRGRTGSGLVITRGRICVYFLASCRGVGMYLQRYAILRFQRRGSYYAVSQRCISGSPSTFATTRSPCFAWLAVLTKHLSLLQPLFILSSSAFCDCVLRPPFA